MRALEHELRISEIAFGCDTVTRRAKKATPDGRAVATAFLFRHARPCAGHPRLALHGGRSRGWPGHMPGHDENCQRFLRERQPAPRVWPAQATETGDDKTVEQDHPARTSGRAEPQGARQRAI